MSVNYPSYFTESLYGIIPASRPFSEGRFYIISISIIFNLLWCEEWGQHEDPHKAVGARQRGTWQGPLGCVKEWVLHLKDAAANAHPHRMETHQKNPASSTWQSSAEDTSVWLRGFHTSHQRLQTGKKRHLAPQTPLSASSSAGLQSQGLGIDAAKTLLTWQTTCAQAVTSTSVAQRSRQIPSLTNRNICSHVFPFWEGERAGRWWSQTTHGGVG